MNSVINLDFSEAKKLKRFPLLDASRGLACLGVVAVHCHFEYMLPWYWGVMDFFFVMSGFLITRSLVSNCDKGRGASSFLLYRALRLLPAYLTVILTYALCVMAGNGGFPREVFPYLFLYQHTDLIAGGREVFPRINEMLPFWSLILEEHYYILWGMLFCFYAYAKLRINLVTLGVVALLFGLALVMRKAGVHYWTLPGRFDGFLAGSIAAMAVFMPQKVRISDVWMKRLAWIAWLLVLLALVRLARSIYGSYFQYGWIPYRVWLDVTCYTIVSVVLVLGMVKMDIRGISFGRMQTFLAFIGLISYEIYLVHFPVASLFKRAYDFNFHNGAFLLYPLTMAVSTGIAYVMHRTLTAPALKRREEIHSSLARMFRGNQGGLGSKTAAATLRNDKPDLDSATVRNSEIP